MATTSIWSIKGWLGKLVVYVENPEKTQNPAYYEKEDMSEKQAQGLSDVIEYAINQKKTQVTDERTAALKNFVSGVNCSPGTARDEMMAVKMRFGKAEGVMAYHGFQSFAPGEANPEMAHEIGLKLAAVLWGEKYQVVVATHLDKKNHLHNHFVVNTVSFVDGIRYHRTDKDYYDMQRESDKLCREYALSVIDEPKCGKSKHYGEWRAEQENRPTWRSLIKNDIDTAIRRSMTDRQFFHYLKEMGYKVKVGKDITVQPSGKTRGFKLARNLGENYTMDGICKQILAQTKPERLPVPEKPRQIRIHGQIKPVRKTTGFRALYYYYCYRLGVFPKERQQSPKRIHFLFREDIIRMRAISNEVRLLYKNHIDTAEQLSSYRNGIQEKIGLLTADRKQLYKKSRHKALREDEIRLTEIKAEISTLSKQLTVLRDEQNAK